MTMNKTDLEDRLIDFAVLIIAIADGIPHSKAGTHLSGQLVRSGTSPALNYGEAQSGESRRGFIHKIKVVLKELRESLVCLKIIQRAEVYDPKVDLLSVLNDNDELVSIFVKSVKPDEKNMKR